MGSQANVRKIDAIVRIEFAAPPTPQDEATPPDPPVKPVLSNRSNTVSDDQVIELDALLGEDGSLVLVDFPTSQGFVSFFDHVYAASMPVNTVTVAPDNHPGKALPVARAPVGQDAQGTPVYVDPSAARTLIEELSTSKPAGRLGLG